MAETYELQFGDLDWSPAAQVDDVQVRVFGLRRGKAVPVVQVVESLIQDGGLERVERFENRDQQVLLAIDASDSDALADYESTLFREVQKVRNELRYTPPDGFGAAGVFDVLWADLGFLEEGEWDLDEVMRGRRNYVLTLRCLPFARSVDPFTVTGVTSTGTTTTTVNDASSTTGWSAVGSALGSGSGEVYVDVDVNNQTLADQPALVYSPASPIDMTGLPYLVVRWRIAGLAGAFDQAPTVSADGQTLTMVNTRYDGVTSRTVSTYICPDTSVASVRIRSPRPAGYVGGATAGTFNVDNLAKSDVAPSTGTSRQKLTAVSVPGSARTPATLQVAHASSALGDVLVYTSPALAAGYVPALSPWAVSAGTTVATNISGKSWSLAGGGQSFDFPASILPRGAYQIVARVKDQSFAPGFETITTTAATRLAGTNVDPSQIVVSKHASTSLSTSAYTNVVLGSFQLPPADVPAGSAAVVRVTIAGSVDLDDAWLLYLPDDGTSHVSLVSCGTAAPAAGGSSNRLFLNAATVDAPYPSCFVGTQPDQSDARAASGASANWSEHLFPAGEGLVFVATSNAEDALVTVEGYARWHTHPAS